jgi:hypothetical protein
VSIIGVGNGFWMGNDCMLISIMAGGQDEGKEQQLSDAVPTGAASNVSLMRILQRKHR